MSMNKFKLNAGKTHMLTVGTQKRLNSESNKLKVYMDGLQLKESETGCEILLGCVIQKDLKWNKNVKELKEKLKKRLEGCTLPNS